MPERPLTKIIEIIFLYLWKKKESPIIINKISGGKK